MKFSIPKIDTSLLIRAREYFNSGIQDYKSRAMKMEGDLLEAFFGILRKVFSTLGSPNLSTSLRIKEDPPRTSPSSEHYNKFLHALDLDLQGSYGDSRSISDAVSKYYNYSQSNRARFDGVLKDVNSLLSDFAIVSQSVNEKDTWLKDTFSNYSHVESNEALHTTLAASVATDRGICTLSYVPTDSVLSTDNILDINDRNVELDPGFIYSTPYYGRQYGLMTEDIPADEGIREQVSTLNTWDARTTRNLVDAEDGVDTYWEVEVTAREDVVSNPEIVNAGPYTLVPNVGNIHIDSADPNRYVYDNGMLLYAARSYPSDFFYNSSTPRQRSMRATLEITLVGPRSMNSIGITRKPEKQEDVSGAPHAIHVDGIEVRDAESGDWVRIPGFKESVGFRSTNETVTSTSNRKRSVGSRSILSSSDRNIIRTTEEPNRTPGLLGSIKGGTTQVETGPDPDILSPADNQFSRTTIWPFDSMMVTAVKIKLSVKYPYKIRYSMHKYNIINKVTWGGSIFGRNDKRSKAFFQYAGGEAVEDMDALSNKSPSRNGLKLLLLSAGVVTILSLAASAVKLVAGLFGWKKGETESEQIVNINPKESSDLYRWSIALSDIFATTAEYSETSELLSRSWIIPQPIAEIRIFTNHELNGGDIEYYIVLPNGTPYRIQPWEGMDRKAPGGKYIPKSLFINSDLPKDRRDRTQWGSGAFIDIDGSLNEFRVRALLRRGPDILSTPVIHDYKVQVRPKAVGGKVRHVK